MNQISQHIKFVINDKLYNKDPESSDLGKVLSNTVLSYLMN